MVKSYFAPVPPRAIGDSRLTGLELRVLACIALHDRLSGPRQAGRGCIAGNARLAAMIGCDYSRLSTAITKLVKLGYVEREPDPQNRKGRIYRVVYNPTDVALVGTVCQPANHCGSADDEPSIVCQPANHCGSANDEPSIVCQPANQEHSLVCQTSEKQHSDQGDNGSNIFRETEKIEKTACEDAPPDGGAGLPEDPEGNWGAKLVKLEHDLNAGTLTNRELEERGATLFEFTLNSDPEGPNHQHAVRLIHGIDNELQRRDAYGVRGAA